MGTSPPTLVDDRHHLVWLRDAGLAPVVLERLAELDATLWGRSFDAMSSELMPVSALSTSGFSAIQEPSSCSSLLRSENGMRCAGDRRWRLISTPVKAMSRLPIAGSTKNSGSATSASAPMAERLWMTKGA